MTDQPKKSMPMFPVELLNQPKPRAMAAAAEQRAEGSELREQADVDHIGDLLDIREMLGVLQTLFDEMAGTDRFDRGRQEQRLGQELTRVISTLDLSLIVARSS
jgi:hypothetical protein